VHVVLVSPEIAPNTGNIIRLCANTGSALHLVEPLGFRLDQPDLLRAGLDYHELVDVTVHRELASAQAALPGRWFAFTSSATRPYTDVRFRSSDVLVFGSERAGLGASFLSETELDRQLRIPMQPGNRSLNLANAVAIVVYEGWRQTHFAGAGDPPTDGHGVTSETPAAPPFDR
jgi:tRNA (cytidine/uridine-2'-O-)-methyltransferase